MNNETNKIGLGLEDLLKMDRVWEIENAETNLFDILDIRSRENSHSKMIAWLLDPNESHGLGREPLRLFLWTVVGNQGDDSARAGSNTAPKYSDIASMPLSDAIVETEPFFRGEKKSGRIDILVRVPIDNEQNSAPILVIENKVNSSENNGQTEVYHEHFFDKAHEDCPCLYVYIDPYGTQEPACKEFRVMNSKALREWLGKLRNLTNKKPKVELLIDEYDSVLEEDMSGDDFLGDMSDIDLNPEDCNKLKEVAPKVYDVLARNDKISANIYGKSPFIEKLARATLDDLEANGWNRGPEKGNCFNPSIKINDELLAHWWMERPKSDSTRIALEIFSAKDIPQVKVSKEDSKKIRSKSTEPYRESFKDVLLNPNSGEQPYTIAKGREDSRVVCAMTWRKEDLDLIASNDVEKLNDIIEEFKTFIFEVNEKLKLNNNHTNDL